MKKVIITGATGMVGNYVLQHCLEADAIGEVVSFVRRASGFSHAKLKEVVLEDFQDYDGQEAHFGQVDAVYFCLGVYTGQVPDAKFKEITVDYVVALSDMLKAHSPRATFCLLSGAGADQEEKSRMAFARYKGMAENYLIGCDFGALHLFRPGYIYPVEKRQEPNVSYRIFRALYPVLKGVMGKNGSITSTGLAKAVFLAGLRGAPQQVLENRDIRAFIGE